jgi:hypothetical protein
MLTFKHDLDGHEILITVRFVERTETWAMLVEVDGELVESRDTDDPWSDARATIEAELAMLDDDGGTDDAEETANG